MDVTGLDKGKRLPKNPTVVDFGPNESSPSMTRNGMSLDDAAAQNLLTREEKNLSQATGLARPKNNRFERWEGLISSTPFHKILDFSSGRLLQNFFSKEEVLSSRQIGDLMTENFERDLPYCVVTPLADITASRSGNFIGLVQQSVDNDLCDGSLVAMHFAEPDASALKGRPAHQYEKLAGFSRHQLNFWIIQRHDEELVASVVATKDNVRSQWNSGYDLASLLAVNHLDFSLEDDVVDGLYLAAMLFSGTYFKSDQAAARRLYERVIPHASPAELTEAAVLSVAERRKNFVEAFIHLGLRMDGMDDSDRSPWDYACEAKNTEIMHILESHGFAK